MRDLKYLALLIKRSNRNLWWGNHLVIARSTTWGIAK